MIDIIVCPYCGSDNIKEGRGIAYNKSSTKKRYFCLNPDCKYKSFTLKEENEFKREKKKTAQEIYNEVEEITKKIIKTLDSRKRLKLKFIKNPLKKEKWVNIFSDLQYGLLVNKIEVGGLGYYNPQVAQERLEYLTNVISRILEYHTNRPEELYIAILGDNIENAYMQENQQSKIAFGICQQILEVEEMLLDYIISLSKFFPIIKIFAIIGGNHGRMGKRKNDVSPTDNFEYLIYSHIKKRLGDIKDIYFDFTPARHMIVEIENWKFWLEHGDTVRSWMGIPFYGIKREKDNINNMLAKFREHADYLLAGHFHTKANFEDIFMNGSFVGGDSYSIGDLRRMDFPYQKLLGVNKKHGVVWDRNICLIDDPRKLEIKIYK